MMPENNRHVGIPGEVFGADNVYTSYVPLAVCMLPVEIVYYLRFLMPSMHDNLARTCLACDQ